MKHEAEVIGKMSMKTSSEKIRQVIMTIMIVAAVLAVLFGKQFAMTVMASAGKVTSTTANVRSQPSTTSDAIASLSKGDTIDIKSQTTGADGYVWYQITVTANTTGYIRSDLVQITDGTTPPTSTGTTTTTTTTTTTHSVNADGVTVVEAVSGTATADVNVRADASTNSEIVAKANNGLTLTVTGTKQGTDGNTWYYLTFTKDGVSTTGFIRSDYVKLSGELKAPSTDTTVPDPTPTTTETTQPTIQKIWDTQEQADGWFLLDFSQGKQYNIDNLFKTNETNTELIEKQEAKIKSLRTGLIILVILLVAAIAAGVIFFMKWKDLDDRAAFAEAEKERTKRIAGHGDGRRTQGQAQERTGRPAGRDGARRDAASGERRRPEGARPADRQPGERPAARPATGERRPVDVQKGQSSHTVRPSENAERRAVTEAPREAAPVREDPRAMAPEPAQAPEADVVERKSHRPENVAKPSSKEHHRKPALDDDDDEFEFGFLNWDDDDK